MREIGKYWKSFQVNPKQSGLDKIEFTKNYSNIISRQIFIPNQKLTSTPELQQFLIERKQNSE